MACPEPTEAGAAGKLGGRCHGNGGPGVTVTPSVAVSQGRESDVLSHAEPHEPPGSVLSRVPPKPLEGGDGIVSLSRLGRVPSRTGWSVIRPHQPHQPMRLVFVFQLGLHRLAVTRDTLEQPSRCARRVEGLL